MTHQLYTNSNEVGVKHLYHIKSMLAQQISLSWIKGSHLTALQQEGGMLDLLSTLEKGFIPTEIGPFL